MSRNGTAMGLLKKADGCGGASPAGQQGAGIRTVRGTRAGPLGNPAPSRNGSATTGSQHHRNRAASPAQLAHDRAAIGPQLVRNGCAACRPLAGKRPPGCGASARLPARPAALAKVLSRRAGPNGTARSRPAAGWPDDTGQRPSSRQGRWSCRQGPWGRCPVR